MKKLLFLSSQVPFRDTRAGGAKRLYYLAKGLEAHFEVYVVSLDGTGEWRARPGATGDFQRFHFLPVDLFRKKEGVRILEAPIDIHADIRKHSEGLRSFLGGATFDVTFAAHPWAISLLHHLEGESLGHLVYLEDDLLLEVYRTRIHTEANFLKRSLYRARHLQLLSFYRKRLKGVRVFVNISEEERQITRKYFPSIDATLFKHGIPLDECAFLSPPKDRLTFGFIGNFNHRPNRDAAEWIVTRFLPVMRKSMPAARVFMAGAGMSAAAAERFLAEPGLEFMGEVDDLASFYLRFGIFLNPIVSGRGLRTKLVEAAAFGRPMLSTPVGAEGLESFDIGIAEAPEEMLAWAANLAGDPDRYARMASGNRRVFESEYSLEAQIGGLLPALEGMARVPA